MNIYLKTQNKTIDAIQYTGQCQWMKFSLKNKKALTEPFLLFISYKIAILFPLGNWMLIIWYCLDIFLRHKEFYSYWFLIFFFYNLKTYLIVKEKENEYR